ncbi:MAG: HEAT repeat domain-containing protein, partial [Planctomycetes bacterium]|nr:HEAT repeat domain-containing protein [Planctomycetota bacterium]
MARPVVSAGFLAVVTILVASRSISAQTEGPDFGPPRRPGPEATPEAQEVSPSPKSQEGLTAQLIHWPEFRGLEAARALAARGSEALPVVLANLDDNDWRIRCGSAWALGEMRDPQAYPRLRRCLDDVANNISMGTFFAALVKIDPVAATSDILPHLGSDYPRTAKEAFEALPPVMDDSFASRLIELLRHRDDEVRFRAVALLARLRTLPETHVFLDLLSDPQARIGRRAADLLSESDRPEVHRELRALFLAGNSRAAAFAGLALVMAEDRQNRIILGPEIELRERALRFARMSGQQLENTAGLSVLANLSKRSTDPELRQIADRHLMPALLGLVFGGVVSKDYGAIKDICLAKVRMLSGENFGSDRDAWISFWEERGDSFVARRELATIDAKALESLELEYSRREEGRSELRVWLKAGAPDGSWTGTLRPIWIASEDLQALGRELDAIDVFADRGMKHDPAFAGDYVELLLRLGAAEFRRAHYAHIPAV